jgi:hypothetical protein
MTLPLIAVATTLRAGRRLFTAEVRITEESTGRLISHATTTYALSAAGGRCQAMRHAGKAQAGRYCVRPEVGQGSSRRSRLCDTDLEQGARQVVFPVGLGEGGNVAELIGASGAAVAGGKQKRYSALV